MSNTTSAPRAFVCHASEDKVRFVEPFARALIAAGVDAWYDGWEIDFGDGLLDRISDGIRSSGFFIFVATPHSLAKPWVKAELEGGFAKRLRGEARFVTLVLDDCANQLPELLKGMRYKRVNDPAAVDEIVKELAPTFFGLDVKPPLGSAPLSTSLPDPPPDLDLTKSDWRVMVALCESTLDDVAGHIQNTTLRQCMADLGLAESSFCDSLEVLQELGFMRVSRAMGPGTLGRGIHHAFVTTTGFEQYLLKTNPDYPSIKRRVLVEIANRDGCNSTDLHAAVAATPRTVIHVAEWADAQGLAKVSFFMGPQRPFVVAPPSVRLRRMMDEQ